MTLRDWTMGGAALVLCAGLACVNSLTQVDKLSDDHQVQPSAVNAINRYDVQGPGLMSALPGLQFRGQPAADADVDTDTKHIVKRAVTKRPKLVKKKARQPVKKAKNSKKRKKLFDKRRKSIESESESKPLKTYSKSGESEKSETAPDFSELYMPWNLPPRPTRSRMPKKSDAKSHPSEISTCEDPTEEMYDPPRRYEKEVIFED